MFLSPFLAIPALIHRNNNQLKVHKSELVQCLLSLYTHFLHTHFLHCTTVLHCTTSSNEKHYSANPQRYLTEMLHVLGEQTGMKLSCIKPTSKVRGLSIEPRSSTGCID